MDMRVAVEGVAHADEFVHDLERVNSTKVTVKA